MRYAIEPKEQRYVTGDRLSFAKNLNKNFSSKYSQNRLNHAKHICHRCL